jgi:hypothetical protein
MDNKLKGILIHTDKFGWQVRYEFGQGQTKYMRIHHLSIQGVEEFGMEGEEVDFEIKGTPVPNTLNGVVSSAFIINDATKKGS